MALALILLLGFGPSPQAPGASAQPNASLIRVRVETDDAGDAAELAARRESVKHLAAAINGRKKAGLVVVANAEDAVDVVVEVEGRGVTVPKVVIGLSGGMGSTAGRTSPAMQPVRTAQLRVTIGMARDSDPTAITNKNRANESESGWKSAADDVAKQVEKWIADHRAAIIAARDAPRPDARSSRWVSSASDSALRPRPSYDHERPSYDQERPSYDQERPSYDQERPSYDLAIAGR